MNIKEASKFSIYNMEELKKCEKAACYYCISIFYSSEIHDTADGDNTALCPNCSIDSVLPESAPYNFDKETLQELHKYWF